jgi:hypothetical protein
MPVLNLDETSQALFTPGPAVGSVTVINLSTADTIYVATTPTVHDTDIPIGPLASMTFDGTQWWYGSAIDQPLMEVAILPGASGYSAGSLTISGPVTAEISGPVTVEGSVDIGNTPTVDLAAGATVDISGTADVNVQNATIDVIGSGGYILPGQLALLKENSGTFSAAHGSSTLLTTQTVSSYSSILFAADDAANSSTSSGAAVCAIWQFDWTDASGNVIGSDTISCLLGCEFTVQIPVKGSQVSVYLVNPGTTGTVSYSGSSVFLWGDYRTVPDTTIISYSVSSLPTVTSWSLIQPSDPVLSIAQWLASLQIAAADLSANTSYLVPLPLWLGPVSGWYAQGAENLAHDITIVDLTYATQGNIAGGIGYAYGFLVNLSGESGASGSIAYNAPPTQQAILFETGSTTASLTFTLTGS